MRKLASAVVSCAAVGVQPGGPDGHADGCDVAQVKVLNNADPECGVCAAISTVTLVITYYQNTLAGIGIGIGIGIQAAVEFIAPSPLKPPRS